jgi:hypothetical protein
VSSGARSDGGVRTERTVAAEHEAFAEIPVLVVATHADPTRPIVLDAILSQDRALVIDADDMRPRG